MILLFTLSVMSTFVGLTPFNCDPRRCCGANLNTDSSTNCCDSCDDPLPLRDCCNNSTNTASLVSYRVLPSPRSCNFTTKNLQKYGCDKEDSHNHLVKHCDRLNTKIKTCKWPGCDYRKKFVDMMIDFLYCYKTCQPNIVEVLYAIYDSFSDFDELLMFLANSIHNTFGFRFLVNECINDRYRSRGLLQITTRPNYCKLGTFYEHNPDALGLFEVKPVVDTIRFWKKYISSGCFSETVRKLNPCEVNFSDEWCKELEKRLKNRYETYCCLCKYFGREPRL